MIFLFIIMLPIVFFVVNIQILIGFLFFIFYLFLFILYKNMLKSDYIIKCEEKPINMKYLYRYAFFNVFLFVPQAKAFLLVYSFLNTVINSNNNKKEKIIFLIIFFIFSFLIKIYIMLIFGYTFLSILVTTNLVISYSEVISWKYESKKAKNQHIVMDCLLDNKNSIGAADDMKIIIEGDNVVFNADKFVKYFLSKVKNPEKVQRAFSPSNKEVFSKKIINGHFSYSLTSPKYKDKNFTKNNTSSQKIKVFKEDGTFDKINCCEEFNPRLDGKNESDHLTRTYEINKKETIIKEVPESIKMKMQNNSKYVYASIIDDKDKTMLYFEKGKMYNKENSPLVKEYAKENKMTINEKIEDLVSFEKDNEIYLNSEEGKKEYEIYKNIQKGGKFFVDNNLDSPKEDFIN